MKTTNQLNIQGRIFPEDANVIYNEKANAVVYTYETDEYYIAKGFSGRRKKPDFFIKFETKERREKYVNDYFDRLASIIEIKAKQKAQAKKLRDDEFKDIKLGDIFYHSWGYEQTNLSFYQLVALKGKTGTFRQINSKLAGDLEAHGMSGDYLPCKDEFIGEEFKKRINGNYVTMNSYSCMKKTDENTKHYCSWYY